MKCAKWLNFFFVLSLVFALTGASLDTGLTEKYLSIRDKLACLKGESALVTEQLTQVLEQLKASQIEAEEWKAQSTTLSEKLMSINEQLNNCLMTIEKLEAEIRLKNKVIGWLLTILVIRTLLMIAGYVLYAKGVHLPRWLDILL